MKSNYELFGFFYVLIGVLFIGLAGYGWIMNIIRLAAMDSALGMILLRAVGIFVAPLGVVLGYIG